MGDDAEVLPLVFGFARVPALPCGEDAAEQLMARRVRQGRPERFDARIGDRAARGFDWTDGVDSILSWFVDLDGGALVEISLAMHPSAGRTGDSVRALAKPLLARVRWV